MTSIIFDPNKLKTRNNDWKVHFTYSNLLTLPLYPESPFIEIMNGKLYVVPSPIPMHQRISRNIEFLILNYLKKNPLAEIFDAPIDVVFSEENLLFQIL